MLSAMTTIQGHHAPLDGIQDHARREDPVSSQSVPATSPPTSHNRSRASSGIFIAHFPHAIGYGAGHMLSSLVQLAD
eukprot:8081083-Pyramimonas_sp.AAC.3